MLPKLNMTKNLEQIFEEAHKLFSKTGNSQDVKGHAQLCERGCAQRCYKTPVIYYSSRLYGKSFINLDLSSVPINTSSRWRYALVTQKDRKKLKE